MKPALSVIFFTTVSGAGYGMLFWTGLLGAVGVLPNRPWFGPVAVLTALALASLGLLASTAHLGRPERAWRAISQWRTSWLSREGIASLLAYPCALGFAVAWGLAGETAAAARALGALAAVPAAATVVCTAMIYRSLKPVRQWHNPFVLPNYLLLAAFSGAVWLAAVAVFWSPAAAARLVATLGVILGIAGAAGKLAYWRAIDKTRTTTSMETATGLGAFGAVRMLEAPNTEENYLLREMGFRIARKHARRLRRLAMGVGFVAPLLLLIAGSVVLGVAGETMVSAAALAAVAGIYIERWLFFAQATHTTMLYYGREI
jgi:DMSO reductase anchor subunit